MIMNFIKQNWIKIGIGIVLLGSLFFINRWATDTPPSQNVSIQELHDKTCELMQAEDYSGALKNAEAVIKIDPNHIGAHVDQGIALYSMGKCVEGAASLYHASMLDPTDETIGAMLGSMLNKCKEAEDKAR